MRNAKTNACLNKIYKYCEEEGRPKRIISDHGTQFYNSKWRENLEKRGIMIGYTSIRHPQSNPAERFMRTIGVMLRIMCGQRHNSWAQQVCLIEDYINLGYSSATGQIPVEIQNGERAILPFERIIKYPDGNVLWDADITRQKVCEYLEKGAKARAKRQIGDLVLVKNLRQSDADNKVSAKLLPIYDGPYEVVHRGEKNCYQVRRCGGGPIKAFNLFNLVPYYSREGL